MSKNRRRIAQGKGLLGVSVIVLWPIVLYLFLSTAKTPTQYDYPSTEYLVCVTEETEYSVAQDGFSIEIKSGERAFELGFPSLEILHKGAWYVLKDDSVKLSNEANYAASRTMELPFIGEHETKEVYVPLWKYRDSLKSGHYRVIVPTTVSREYFSFEFDLV